MDTVCPCALGHKVLRVSGECLFNFQECMGSQQSRRFDFDIDEDAKVRTLLHLLTTLMHTAHTGTYRLVESSTE